MVKKSYKQQQRINCAMKLLDPKYRATPYDPRISTHNCLEHELAKCKLIYNLKSEGKEVYSEAIFKSGGRADLFIPEDFRVIEILHSETEQMAKKKIKKYPEEVEIFLLKSEDVLNG